MFTDTACRAVTQAFGLPSSEQRVEEVPGGLATRVMPAVVMMAQLHIQLMAMYYTVVEVSTEGDKALVPRRLNNMPVVYALDEK